MIPPEYDDIDRFQEFVIGLFVGDPRLGQVQPAQRSEIERLVELAAPHVLPSLYLGYLERYGGNDGPIQLAEDSHASAASVIRHVSKKREKAIAPPNCVLICTHGILNAVSLHYAGAPTEGPEVAAHEYSRIQYLLAGSFGSFAYRQAWFSRYFTGPYERRVHLRASDADLSTIERQLADMGFAKAFFSDPHGHCSSRGAHQIFAFARSGTVFVHVGGDDTWSTRNVGTDIAREIGLEVM